MRRRMKKTTGIAIRGLAVVAAVLVVPILVEAHVGDRVFPIPELTDEMLAQIDLRDGLVDDWIDVVGEPLLTPVDFALTSATPIHEGLVDAPGTFNAADFDFRIWLAWHDKSDRLVVAGQFVDDIFVNDPEGFGEFFFFDDYDVVRLHVDGDHSGPPYLVDGSETLHSLAQEYVSMAGVSNGSSIHLCCEQNSGMWMIGPPYSDGGGLGFGENPTIWVVEFMVTPFDRILWDDPDGSTPSTLDAGETIGLSLSVEDHDLPAADFTYYALLPGITWWQDQAADGLLAQGR